MLKIPLFVLFFYSIPESILLISLSSSLYGYNVKSNFKRIFLLSICLALTTYFVRLLPIKLGLNVLIQIPIFIFLTVHLLKISFKKSLLIILTGFTVISLLESIVFTLAALITGYPLKNLLANGWLWMLCSSVTLFSLLILTLFILKKQITFVSACKFLKNTAFSNKMAVIVFTALIQAILAGLLQITYMIGQNNIVPVLFNDQLLKTIAGIALIIIPLVSIFIVKKVFDISEHEATRAAQEVMLENINNLVLTLKSQRHDFANHLQVIQGLLQLKKHGEAYDYLTQLVGENRETGEILSVDNLAVTALLRSKQAMAVAHGINLEINITCPLKTLRIKSFDLVKILGNLLDNAIDAVQEQNKEFRRVILNVFMQNNFCIFQIANPRPVIPGEILKNIFEPGFSTKDGAHSGQGLFIVKKLIYENSGSVEVHSSESGGTVFTVKIPL